MQSSKSPPQAFLAKYKWDWYEFTAFPHTSFEILWKLLLVKFKVKVGTRGIWPCHFVPYLQGQHQATGAGLKGVSLLLFFPEKMILKIDLLLWQKGFPLPLPHPKVLVPQLHLLLLNLISTPSSRSSHHLSRRRKKKCAFNFNSRAIPLKAHRGSGHASQQWWWHCDCQKDTSLPWLKCEFDSICGVQCRHTWRWILVFRKREILTNTHIHKRSAQWFTMHSPPSSCTHIQTHTRLESPSCLPLFTYHLQAIPLHLWSEEDGPSHSVSKAERNVM